GVTVEGYRGERTNARFNAVGPGYFQTVGIDLLAGREFTPADDERRPKVAIVNETFARRFGLMPNPVGRRITPRRTRPGEPDTLTLGTETVGLVRDSKYNSVKDSIPPVFAVPHTQQNLGEMNFYVRTDGDVVTILRQIPGVVRTIDP